MRRFRYLIGLLLINLSLSACGFQLSTQARPLKPYSLSGLRLYVETPAPYGPFYRQFYAQSREYGLKPLAYRNHLRLPPQALRLSLQEPVFEERALSYSRDAQANYLLMECRLAYTIFDSKGTCLSQDSLFISRPMSVSPNDLLYNSAQADALKQVLREAATTQLLQRIAIYQNT